MINRTVEKVLSILSLVFTTLALIPSFILVIFGKAFSTTGELRQELEAEVFADPTLEPEEAQMVLSILDSVGGFGWFIVIVLLISLVATIIGMVAIWNNKNPKLAGIMFIIAGLFVFVLSPTSIALYVAAILSFTKKPTYNPTESSFEATDLMRPL